MTEYHHRKNLINCAQFIGSASGLTVLGFTFFVFLGAFYKFPDLYRPLDGGEATHPITALLFMVLGVLLLLINLQHTKRLITINLVTVSIVFSLLILIDKIFGLNFIDNLTSHIGAFSYEESIGLTTEVSLNTGIVFLLLSIRHGLYLQGLYKLTLTAECVALSILSLSFVGYFTHDQTLYGNMSLLTLSLGALLSVVSILSTTLTTYTNVSRAVFLGLANTLILIPFAFLISYLLVFDKEASLFSFITISFPWVIVYLALLTYLAIENVEVSRFKKTS